MDASIYVLRNKATTTAFRHETLDAALDALNDQVGETDRWVLFEIDRRRIGAGRRVAEGRGPVKLALGQTAVEPNRTAPAWPTRIEADEPA